MSVLFPTDKDNVIDELDDIYELELTEQESKQMRGLTLSELYLVTVLFARARRRSQLHSKE